VQILPRPYYGTIECGSCSAPWKQLAERLALVQYHAGILPGLVMARDILQYYKLTQGRHIRNVRARCIGGPGRRSDHDPLQALRLR
jgi:hypothetical protein